MEDREKREDAGERNEKMQERKEEMQERKEEMQQKKQKNIPFRVQYKLFFLYLHPKGYNYFKRLPLKSLQLWTCLYLLLLKSAASSST